MRTKEPTLEDVRPTADVFADVARKWRFVLGLDPAARVLLVGPLYSAQDGDFARAFGTVRACASAEEWEAGAFDDTYDLICVDARARWGGRATSALVARAASMLAVRGILLVACGNRFAPERIGRVLRGRNRGRDGDATPRSIRRTLRIAGLEVIEQFLAVPSLEEVDDYRSTAMRRFDLPWHASQVSRLASRMGFYPSVHEDMLFVASRPGTAPLASVSARIMTPIAPRSVDAGAWRVERFALRRRGAAVLGLTDGSRGVIARVASTGEVADRIARNTRFTDRIHALTALAGVWREVVPRALGAFDSGDVTVFVEPTMPGILAWKLPHHGAAARRAHEDAIAFITALGDATRHRVVVDPGIFVRLVGASLETVHASLARVGASVDSTERVRRALHRRLLGTEVAIVWGHGDFGFGNLLVDRVTGRLQGVIDWDTHVEEELAGVDLANLELQRETALTAGDVAVAFDRIAVRTAPAGQLALAIAGIRLIARSVPYPAEFARLAGSYSRLIDAIARCIGSDDAPAAA